MPQGVQEAFRKVSNIETGDSIGFDADVRMPVCSIHADFACAQLARKSQEIVRRFLDFKSGVFSEELPGALEYFFWRDVCHHQILHMSCRLLLSVLFRAWHILAGSVGEETLRRERYRQPLLRILPTAGAR
ncbi:MAG: hypothetical protein E4H28_03435 [Gemmatimonadales bacterium]|nr:MAG: hypothetical protein E4H28_03435 [Gemmatimonadales bacterium]